MSIIVRNANLVLLFLLNSYFTVCQNLQEGVFEVITEEYQGYIWGMDYPQNLQSDLLRWVPTLKEVEEAEKFISMYIKNTELADSISCLKALADMKVNLKNYLRQYFGYMAGNGDRILVVDGVDKELLKRLNKEDYFKKCSWTLFATCALQWSFTINMETMEVVNFFYGG